MIAEKKPYLRLTRFRLLLVLAVVAIAVSATVPTAFLWAMQRTDLHARWELEQNYASQFGFQIETASSYMNDTYGYKWSGETSSFAGVLIGYADQNLNLLRDYDTDHSNKLYPISYAIERIVVSFFENASYANASYAQRAPLERQLYSLGDRILYAYSNFLKYTSEGGTAGPPFSYSGPTPPDESLLQDAVNIALALQAPT